MKVRTRFAPSPTGYLHVGGLRTALYNYLFAKQNNGEFILRIEDTDQNRIIQSATENLCDILSRLNLDYDFGPNKEDQYGPYIQSSRVDIYKKHYIQLIKSKKAYICFGKDELYPEYNVEKALKRIQNEPFVVKLKVNNNKTLSIKDQIRGNINFDLSIIEDPIIIKSDGYPTYHFANVVDDYLMQITDVIRGEEWIPSLPKHITLYQAFNWDYPKFYHLPLLLNPDKSKLSKRQGDVAVEDFLNNGFLENTLINFVALLGWHPKKDNQELFSIDELIHEFSMKKINKSGAIFDKEKLNWMNREYIKKITPFKFQTMVKNTLTKNKISKSNIDILKISHYAQQRINTINNIWDEIKCFYIHSKSQIEGLKPFDYNNLFSLWIKELETSNTITPDTIQIIIKNTKTSLNISGKNLFIPLRIGLINKIHGPDLFSIIDILGTKESIKRLRKYQHGV